MARYLLLFSAFIFTLALTGQDIDYARKTVNKLCSPKYNGRGYVKNGDGMAAEFIYKELKKLKGFEVQYQPFAFKVNTFPGKMEVKVDGKKLKPGIDYMVDPGCPSVKGKYRLVYATHETFATEEAYLKFVTDIWWKSQTNAFVVIDTLPDMGKEEKARFAALMESVKNKNGTGVINLSNKKLMWSVDTEQSSFPTITIKEDKFPRTAQWLQLNVEAKYLAHSTNNVLGYIKGSTQPDSIIVLSAHYDHLGRMGKKTYFPGANDNASGTAILLDLAKHYSQNPPEFSVLFIAFAAEEAGLIGSYYYVQNQVYPLSKMKFLINLDLIGTGEKGVMAVNGLVFTPEYDALVKINEEKGYLSTVQARGKAANSDHYWFTEQGVHSFFFYLMGDFPYYHDPEDRAEILPLTEYEDSFRLIRDFMDYLQNK